MAAPSEPIKDIGNTNSKDMGNTFLMKEVEPMPWKDVTVSEQRQRFLEDYLLNNYPVTELAERFGISRNTAYTHPGNQGRWINRYTW
jgi:hypothetical protein